MPDAPVKPMTPAPARLYLFNREMEWDGVSYQLRLGVLRVGITPERRTWHVFSDLSNATQFFDYVDLKQVEHTIEQHVLKLSRGLRELLEIV